MVTNFNIARDKNDDIRETKKIDRLIFIGIVIFTACIPLILNLKVTDYISPIITNEKTIASGIKGELFTYYKFVFLIGMTLILLCFYMYKIFVLNNKVIQNLIIYLIFMLTIIIALSSVFSNYNHLSLFGIYNRHDGALTYICSIIIFFIAANIKYSKKRMMVLLFSMIPIVIINAIIGWQFIHGNDLLQSNFVQKLLLSSDSNASATAGSSLQSTLNNPNYVSGFAAMLVVVFVAAAFLLKSWKYKASFIILAALSFIMLLCSRSTSGFLTIVVLIPFIIVYAIIQCKLKQVFIPFIAIIILFSSSLFYLADKNEQIWRESMGFFKISNPFSEKDESFSGDQTYSIQTSLINRAYAEEAPDYDNLKLPEFPQSNYSAGSGRTYIWDRTLSLILEEPLLGHGLDTIIYEFPQYEVEKQAGLGAMEVLVDKPHNIYLGIGYGSGVIALFIFLASIILFLYQWITMTIKNRNFQTVNYLFIFFVGTIAYLIQGMFNDSIIGVTQIFWVFFGVCMSIIHDLTSKEPETN